MQFILEHASLAIGVFTSIIGVTAWYSAYVRRQYAAERDFQHLKRNYEGLRDAVVKLTADQDERFDKIDLAQIQIQSILQSLWHQYGRGGGDSQGWN
jgi:hypothetical protein